jgi:hypothetical protein
MGSLTQFLDVEILNRVFNGTAYTPPSTVYIGLSSTQPTQVGGSSPAGWTETVYTNYARQAISFGAAASRSIAQSALVTFPTCGATGDTVDYWGLFDASTGGNLLAFGQLAASKNIVSGNVPSIASGQVTVSVSASGSSGGWMTSFVDTLLNWLFAAGSLAAYSTICLDLAVNSATPAQMDAGTTYALVSGNNYSEETTTSWTTATTQSAGTPASLSNNSLVSFPAPSGSWGTITFGIASYNSSAVPIAWIAVTNQAVTSGDTAEFTANQFVITAL